MPASTLSDRLPSSPAIARGNRFALPRTSSSSRRRHRATSGGPHLGLRPARVRPEAEQLALLLELDGEDRPQLVGWKQRLAPGEAHVGRRVIALLEMLAADPVVIGLDDAVLVALQHGEDFG